MAKRRLVAIDSMKVSSTDAAPDLDHPGWTYQAGGERPNGTQVHARYTAQPNIQGIGRLVHIPATDKTIIDVGAKSLGAHYLDGITDETIPLLADAINDTGLMVVRDSDISTALVLTLDVCRDIIVDDPARYAQSLRLLQHPGGQRRWRSEHYPTSTVLYYGPKRSTTRLEAYDKKYEYAQTPLTGLTPSEYKHVADQLEGRLRLERRSWSYTTTRDIAWTREGETTVADVLNAPTCPVARAYREVRDLSSDKILIMTEHIDAIDEKSGDKVIAWLGSMVMKNGVANYDELRAALLASETISTSMAYRRANLLREYREPPVPRDERHAARRMLDEIGQALEEGR